MTMLAKSVRILLIVLTLFLALTVFGGAYRLLSPPVEMLKGIFKD